MLVGEHISRWLQEIGGFRRVALDTNAVIYYLQVVSPYWELVQHLFRMMERGLMVGTISTVVEAEVLVKPLHEGDQEFVDQAGLFFRAFPNMIIRAVDRGVAQRSAMVRAQTGLQLPDAMIVATALEERCDAIIGNDISMAAHITEIPYLLLENYLS